MSWIENNMKYLSTAVARTLSTVPTVLMFVGVLVGSSGCPDDTTPTPPTTPNPACDTLFSQAEAAAYQLADDLTETHTACDDEADCYAYYLTTGCGDFSFVALHSDSRQAVEDGLNEINILYCDEYLELGCEPHHHTPSPLPVGCIENTCAFEP